jgi:preprotein translocase subunit SecB
MTQTKTPADSEESLKLYPIQLANLGVKELSIRAHVPPEGGDVKIGLKDCSIIAGHGDYDVQEKTIAVSLRLEAGGKEDDLVTIKIELMGLFIVDEKRFPINRISEWASRNAPVILYPFLREHTYALTARCGFRPLTLPLVVVPTFKIDKPKQTKPRAKASK